MNNLNPREEMIENLDFIDVYSPHVKNLQTKGNGHAQGLCPFHNDNNPSFSVNLHTGQFNCFGCKKSGSVFDFYGQMNALNFDGKSFIPSIKEMADDFCITLESLNGKAKSPQEKALPQKRLLTAKAKKAPEKLGPIENAYNYSDGKGNPVFEVCRFEGKDFRLRRPDPNEPEKYIWNTKGIDPVPYNLKDVRKARRVFVCEGEKDADNLMDNFAVTTTTNAMGANSWKPELNSYFKGKHIVILPDNDNAGRERGQTIANNLTGIANVVKIIHLPGLKEKGDVSDWISAGNRKKDLMFLVKTAKIWKPSISEPEEEDSAGSHLDVLEQTVFDSSKFLAMKLKKPRFILNTWLTEGSYSMIYGRPGCGKSWLALIIAVAVTRADSVANPDYAIGSWAISKQVGTLFIDGEMNEYFLQERIAKLKKGKGSDHPDFPLRVLSASRLSNSHNCRFYITDETWRDAVTDYLKRHPKITLIILDNLLSLVANSDPNEIRDWDPINKWLVRLRAMGISIILIHHSTKKGDSQLGTIGREINLDASLKLERSGRMEAAAKFEISFDKGARNASPSADLSPFKIQLEEDEITGEVSWKKGTLNDNKDIIKGLLLDGKMKNKDIAKAMGYVPSYITKIKNELKENGLLDQANKATNKGKETLALIGNDYDLGEFYE